MVLQLMRSKRRHLLMTDFLIGLRRWDAQELIRGYKPRFFHPHKGFFTKWLAQEESEVTASSATLDGQCVRGLHS